MRLHPRVESHDFVRPQVAEWEEWAPHLALGLDQGSARRDPTMSQEIATSVDGGPFNRDLDT
jgi:hypothetical protein